MNGGEHRCGDSGGESGGESGGDCGGDSSRRNGTVSCKYNEQFQTSFNRHLMQKDVPRVEVACDYRYCVIICIFYTYRDHYLL